MKTGVVTPKVTSKLERLMRGAAILTRIMIKRISSPKEWGKSLVGADEIKRRYQADF
jgi:hypothetical protein